MKSMRRTPNCCLWMVLFFCVLSVGAPDAGLIPATGSAEVFFSPNGGATEAIVREIDAAKSEVLVQAYSFTSVPIAQALLNAKKRGIRIEAVLDKSQRSERYTAATFLMNAGINVVIDDRHAIAHNKIIIIDRASLITGSFNFSKNADQNNAENLLILKGNKPLIDKYLANYRMHRDHSVPYEFASKKRKLREG
jgi:phosphatidylserine/phosphatidylglycerophosphate/cardiolipin synthase-like enzyme